MFYNNNPHGLTAGAFPAILILELPLMSNDGIPSLLIFIPMFITLILIDWRQRGSGCVSLGGGLIRDSAIPAWAILIPGRCVAPDL